MAVVSQKSSVKIFDMLVPFLIVLIFAGVVGSFFYYIIQPELQKYLPGGPMNYESVKELLDTRTAYRNDLKTLADFTASASKNAQDPIMLVLPSDGDIPTLYALFEKLAQDIGVGLQTLDISSRTEDAKNTEGKIKQVPISFRFVNVDYLKLKILLAALESTIRLTDIDSLSYDPVSKTASIDVHTYYFSQ